MKISYQGMSEKIKEIYCS